MPDLNAVTAADYLEARNIVANEIRKHTQVQGNTRREIAEGLLSRGWLDVSTIIESTKPQAEAE